MEATTAPGAEMVARPPTGNSLRRIAESFNEEEKGQIAAYLGIPADEPALIPYLATCAQYQLDPVMGQIWLMPMKEQGQDGQPGKKVLKPAVGRDGFLAIARRTPEYEGMEYDVVCSNDTFQVKRSGGKIDILHEYPSIPKAESAQEAVNYRGTILGAYCRVQLRGQLDHYYWAPLKEHAQVGTSGSGEKYYQRAWKYTSVMILKSAQSVALRLALGITGIVPADELRPEDRDADAVAEEPPAPEEFLDGLAIPDRTKDRLKELVTRANDADPNSWSYPKLRMRLSGKDEEAALPVCAEIEAELMRREEREAEEDATLVLTAHEVQPDDLIELDGEWRKVADVLDAAEEGHVELVFEEEDVNDRAFGLEDEVHVRRGA